MRNFVCSMVLLAALALVPGCGDDPAAPEKVGPRLMPLTSRVAVLNNIEYAYNSRRIDAIDDLLDEDFTFFFAPGDVGGEIPEQWPRTDELQTTNDLFRSNHEPVPNGPECTSIDVDIKFEDGVEWTAIIPEDWPTETWYIAEVDGSFIFKMTLDATYRSRPGANAQFTVREVAVEDGTEWRLVEWRELGNSLVAGPEQRAGSPETSWGAIKALYR